MNRPFGASEARPGIHQVPWVRGRGNGDVVCAWTLTEIRRLGVALGLCLALLLAGCSEATGQAKDTVLRYNSLLCEGYSNLDMSRLSLVATREQAAKVYHHMAAMGEGRMRMEAVLEKIDFLTIQKNSAGRMEVETAEQWGYRYVNIDSGEEAVANKIAYKLRYHLRKVTDVWQVEAIDINSSENRDGSKTLPFLERPAFGPSGQTKGG